MGLQSYKLRKTDFVQYTLSIDSKQRVKLMLKGSKRIIAKDGICAKKNIVLKTSNIIYNNDENLKAVVKF